ncbi:hypothetical protein Tco_1281851 [Tanacetum coccineum]
MRLSIRSWVTEWKGLPLLLLAKKQSRTVVSDGLRRATVTMPSDKKSAKSTARRVPSSSMASLIICLATNQKFNLSKYIFDAMKVFANMKRAGKDFSGRITPLFDTMMVQATKEVGSKQEAEVPQDEAEHEESVPTPSNDHNPSGEEIMQPTIYGFMHEIANTSFLDLQKAKDAQAQEIAALKKRTRS